MNNVFIGWSGNRELAKKIANLIEENNIFNPIVGGGSPKDIFIGAQVIDQIKTCKRAILLVEDKEDGMISHNLMFEWGYIMARLNMNCIHVFLINKKSRDLPSDLLGSWVCEIEYDKKEESIDKVSEKIYKIFNENTISNNKVNYIDYFSDWKQIYVYLTDDIPDSDQETFDFVFTGLLMAYYYQDYNNLSVVLNKVPQTVNTISFVTFAKAYIDVFLDTGNMTNPLSQEKFFSVISIFEQELKRKKTLPEESEILYDILANDIYSLSCGLYLRNPNVDENIRKHCYDKTIECAKKALNLIDEYEKISPINKCVVALFKSYIYSDLAQIYLRYEGVCDTFLEYQELSVQSRKSLWLLFSAFHPENEFLCTKFEQEYILALSLKCTYMEDSFEKEILKNTVITKTTTWEKELIYASSLTDRIKLNIKNFKS